MAQAIILAPGQTAATSTDIVIVDGSTKSVGIYVAGSGIPSGIALNVMMDTPGADAVVAQLTSRQPAVALAGPGTYRVTRPLITDQGVDVGVFSE